MCETPATSLDLLKNIKLAMKQHLLLTDGFYSDQNLKRVTGGRKISRVGENREHVMRVEISGFGDMIKPSWDNSRNEGAIAILCRKEAQPGDAVEARLNLWLHNEDERVSYRNMEKLFGQQWGEAIARSGETCRPSLHKNGNKEMQFSMRTDNGEQIIRLLFSPRANLELASFIDIGCIDNAPSDD